MNLKKAYQVYPLVAMIRKKIWYNKNTCKLFYFFSMAQPSSPNKMLVIGAVLLGSGVLLGSIFALCTLAWPVPFYSQNPAEISAPKASTQKAKESAQTISNDIKSNPPSQLSKEVKQALAVEIFSYLYEQNKDTTQVKVVPAVECTDPETVGALGLGKYYEYDQTYNDETIPNIFADGNVKAKAFKKLSTSGLDFDADGVPTIDENYKLIDNCPFTPNPNQEDVNQNKIGDACESDPAPVNLDSLKAPQYETVTVEEQCTTENAQHRVTDAYCYDEDVLVAVIKSGVLSEEQQTYAEEYYEACKANSSTLPCKGYIQISTQCPEGSWCSVSGPNGACTYGLAGADTPEKLAASLTKIIAESTITKAELDAIIKEIIVLLNIAGYDDTATIIEQTYSQYMK